MSAAPMRARLDAGEPVNIWPAPDMSVLGGGRTKPPGLPSGMFGSTWDLINDLAAGAGSPINYVALGLIGVAASLIGGKRRVQPFATSNQWVDPCILWIALLSDPSTNKSPGMDAVVAPLPRMEQDHAENHKSLLMQFEAQTERAKAERARWQETVKAATKEA